VIDKLHGGGRLPKIPVTYADDGAGFMWNKAAGSPVGIELKPGIGIDDRLQLVHEIGHFLDLSAIGRAGRMESMSGDPLMRDWLGAVLSSKGVAAIRNERGYTLDEKDYLLSAKELWARSYTQWLVLRGNDPELYQAFQDMRDKVPHWDGSDFEPIAQAIDSVFSKSGLLI